MTGVKPRVIRKFAAAAVGLFALTACSPADLVAWQSKTGTTTTVTVKAKAGPDRGDSGNFAAQVVCEGEPFWRTGNAVSVNNGTPDADGWFYSQVYCYSNRAVVATGWNIW